MDSRSIYGSRENLHLLASYERVHQTPTNWNDYYNESNSNNLLHSIYIVYGRMNTKTRLIALPIAIAALSITDNVPYRTVTKRVLR
jgi:hypothetical protein